MRTQLGRPRLLNENKQLSAGNIFRRKKKSWAACLVCIFMIAKDLIESRTHDADTARGEYSKHEGGQKAGGGHEDAEESKDKGFPMCAALSAVCIIRKKKRGSDELYDCVALLLARLIPPVIMLTTQSGCKKVRPTPSESCPL